MTNEYFKLADILIEQSSKEQLAECARLLAMNLAHYQEKFGDLPLEEELALLDLTKLNEAQEQLLITGMINLIGVLCNVCSELSEVKH